MIDAETVVSRWMYVEYRSTLMGLDDNAYPERSCVDACEGGISRWEMVEARLPFECMTPPLLQQCLSSDLDQTRRFVVKRVKSFGAGVVDLVESKSVETKVEGRSGLNGLRSGWRLKC